MGVVTCPVCTKDISRLGARFRDMHVLRCLGEDVEDAGGDLVPIDSTIVLEAPVILKQGDGNSVEPLSESESIGLLKNDTEVIPTDSCENLNTINEISEVEVVQKERDVKVVESTETVELDSTEAVSIETIEEAKSKSHTIENTETTDNAKRKPGRYLPYYKVLDLGNNVKFAVDAFSYGEIPGVSAYFLSHFHSDHYGGLSKSWSHGPIYCSRATANLTERYLGVDPKYLRVIPGDGECCEVDNVKVYIIDANHCPGSVLFLFVSKTKRILHTGDFRASEEHVQTVRSLVPGMLDIVYLDTTYLSPKYCFPSQDKVIRACAEYCREMITNDMPSAGVNLNNFFRRSSLKPKQNKPLVYVGSYSIGKERLAVGIAQMIGSTIFAQEKKMDTFELLGDRELSGLLNDNGWESNVHVVKMSDLSLENLQREWKNLSKKFSHLIAIIPTGWTFGGSRWSGINSSSSSSDSQSTLVSDSYQLKDLEKQRKVVGKIHILKVPYSEHSSFQELEHFCRNIHTKRIIPTVK